MAKQQRQQSLINARRACLMLAGYAAGEDRAALLTDEHREFVASLLEEFGRLDKNARRPRAGRPRIETTNPKTLAQRRWRDKQKN